MKAICYAIALLLVLASMVRAEDNDREKARVIIKELKTLHKAGVALHKKYDLNNLSDLKACVAANSKYRDQGKRLKQRSMDGTLEPHYRINLVPAADAAFQCVYCSESSLKACSQIQPEIAELEKKLKVK